MVAENVALCSENTKRICESLKAHRIKIIQKVPLQRTTFDDLNLRIYLFLLCVSKSDSSWMRNGGRSATMMNLEHAIILHLSKMREIHLTAVHLPALFRSFVVNGYKGWSTPTAPGSRNASRLWKLIRKKNGKNVAEMWDDGGESCRNVYNYSTLLVNAYLPAAFLAIVDNCFGRKHRLHAKQFHICMYVLILH